MRKLKHAFMVFCLAIAAYASAAGGIFPTIQASQGWVRWLPGGLPAAGYLTIHNAGDRPIGLVQESSPDYESVMLHQTTNKNGTDHMETIERLTIPARSTVDISPGKYHFMLMHARHPVTPGHNISIRLRFSDGETMSVRFAVRSPSGAN